MTKPLYTTENAPRRVRRGGRDYTLRDGYYYGDHAGQIKVDQMLYFLNHSSATVLGDNEDATAAGEVETATVDDGVDCGDGDD